MASLKEKLLEYIGREYHCMPEHLWLRYPNYVVFRRVDNKKWFCLIMDVPQNKLGRRGTERIDILNVKMSSPFLADFLAQQEGYCRGYHISRGSWVSIFLDGTVPWEEICQRVGESYAATAGGKRKRANKQES